MEATLMEATLKVSAQQAEQPKRLSKVGQWLRDNPGGVMVVNDWRAVNR
ncbi:MAG: hypothetical protein LBN23_03110 [Paludibacter sp.]|jgi:hypothetical protein|nr:hypothetical protein [Paludibacter sp.]